MQEEPMNADLPAPPKPLCSVTLELMPGGQGIQIRSAGPAEGFERSATFVDLQGIALHLTQHCQAQMTARALIQIEQHAAAQAQAQAEAQAAIQAAQGNGGRKRGGLHVPDFLRQR